jgi:hypothetical protein
MRSLSLASKFSVFLESVVVSLNGLSRLVCKSKDEICFYSSRSLASSTKTGHCSLSEDLSVCIDVVFPSTPLLSFLPFSTNAYFTVCPFGFKPKHTFDISFRETEFARKNDNSHPMLPMILPPLYNVTFSRFPKILKEVDVKFPSPRGVKITAFNFSFILFPKCHSCLYLLPQAGKCFLWLEVFISFRSPIHQNNKNN